MRGPVRRLAWKALDYFAAREKNRVRMASGEIEEELDANLEELAEERNAQRAGYYVRRPDTNLYYRVVHDNGGNPRLTSLRAILAASGLRLTVAPAKSDKRRKASRTAAHV